MAGALLGLGARLGARAGAGMGIGYTSSRLSGGDDYDIFGRDGAIDAGLGMLGFGFAGKGSVAPHAWNKLLSNNRGRAAFGRGLALAMLPFTESPISSGGVAPKLEATRPIQGPIWNGQRSPAGQDSGAGFDLSSLMVDPVNLSYIPGKAPSFGKTLNDYLADKKLQGLVNQNIFQMNKPLLDANKAEQTQRARDLEQNNYIGAGLQQAYDKRIESQKGDNAAAEARAAARRKLLEEQTALAEGQVPTTYMEGEAAKAKGDAAEAAANESALSDALIDRLARAGESYLADLKGAQQAQTRVDSKNIVDKADDQIKANVSQIRQNQAQRGTLLGALASEQYKNAIDLHNMAMQQYNSNEDRRFGVASTNADMAFKTRLANAELQAKLVDSMASGGEELSPERQAIESGATGARKTYDKLNTALSELKTKMVENPKTGEMQPYASTPAGKKEIALKRKERNRLQKKYGF